jgi:7-cyano-7-deazaguanine synthase in queuosine biosynthesis
MRRHSLICRYGASDRTTINVIEQESQQTAIQFVQSNRRFDFGIGDALNQVQKWGIQPTESAHDLLVLAATVYCADTRINRQSESQDSWTREVDIYLPVHDVAMWNNTQPLLRKTLEFLTGDKWRFVFRSRPHGFSQIVQQARLRLKDSPTSACLFSGGLDSFIGAIDLLETGETPLLVSHSWVPNVSGHQSECDGALRNQYGKTRIRRLESRVGFHKGIVRGNEPENTERSRSLLFFSLAAFAASGLGQPNVSIYVPENGLISLNVPLDPLRLGSLSTRTTHPYYMARFDEILRVLGISARVVNPYAHQTKGEMVRNCKNQQFLADKVALTMSCASPTKGRWQGLPPGHCGYCLPCLIRRASMLEWNQADPTVYHAELKGRVFDSLKAESDNIRSFQLSVSRLNNDIRRARVLIHKVGPLGSDVEELEALAQLYLCGMREVAQALKGVQTAPNATGTR